MNLIRRLAVSMMIALAALAPLGVQPSRATVNSSVSKTIVLGNGSATQFTFNFVGVASAYISVILTDVAGNETVLTSGAGATQYQIALNAPVQGAIWGLGGTVTYNPSGTPIPAGSTLTIFRTLPLTQAISLSNQSSIQALGKGAETGLDTGTMQSQQIAENIARAIVAPIVDAVAPLPLPPIAQRANQGAVFDGSGNLTAGALPATGVISAAMQPVVNAATLALGRTALGLRALAQEGIGAGLQDDGAGNARVNSQLISVSTNQVVDATFAQNRYLAVGPINFTLARVNTLWNGFSFQLYVVNGPVTLIPDVNDSVQGTATGATVAIPANSVATLTGDGLAAGHWRVQWTAFNVDGAAKSFIAPLSSPSVHGLVLANAGVLPDTRATITATDVIMVNPTLYPQSGSAVSVTVDLTTGTVVSTANGLDGEAMPANGDVFFWLIGNGAAIAGLASSSSTTPTLPTGYTFKKYVGAMKTVSSALKRTRQVGRQTQYQITAGSNTTTLPGTSAGTAGAWTPINAVPFVPLTATSIRVILSANAMATNGFVELAPNSFYPTTTGNASIPCSFTNSTASPISINQNCELVLESGFIYYGSNAGSALTLSALGWTDNQI